MTKSVDRRIHVHPAKSSIVGERVVLWNQLPDDQGSGTGHEARVHDGRFQEQWRPDSVYIHELAPGSSILNIGTSSSGEDSWVYDVDPTLPLELNPERGGHLISSRMCDRAHVIRYLHKPGSFTESRSGRP